MRQPQTPESSRRVSTESAVVGDSAPNHLPEKVRELIYLIGMPATWRLVDEYGGQTLHVPVGKRPKGRELLDEIGEVIGAEAAGKLSLNFGGEYVYIPLCKRAMLAPRDASLQERFDALTSKDGIGARAAVLQLVREFGISDTTVWRVLKRHT